MLLEAVVDIEAAPTWAPENKCEAHTDWQSVDRALRTIAGRRAALDADEARWLREAEALQIWRPLGMVSALDYMERVLGYAPRTAQERLRVARSLAGHVPDCPGIMMDIRWHPRGYGLYLDAWITQHDRSPA